MAEDAGLTNKFILGRALKALVRITHQTKVVEVCYI